MLSVKEFEENHRTKRLCFVLSFVALVWQGCAPANSADEPPRRPRLSNTGGHGSADIYLGGAAMVGDDGNSTDADGSPFSSEEVE